MILYALIIIITLITIALSEMLYDISHSNDSHLQIAGKYESAYYYHGSQTDMDIIEPRRTLYGDVVFATSDKLYAIIFGVKWDDRDLIFGGDNGTYLIERYRGAFDKLRQPCYLYYLSPDGFRNDDLGLAEEYISPSAATPIKKRYIRDVYKEISHKKYAAKVKLIERHKTHLCNCYNNRAQS